MTFVNCCPNCFNDNYLIKYIQQKNIGSGKCSYCKTDSKYLIHPILLRDFFETVIGIYSETNTDGTEIVQLLNEDWEVFSKKLHAYKTKNLLSDILGDTEIVKRSFAPVNEAISNTVEQWHLFREELKHKNRFFPDQKPDLDRLKTLLNYLLFKEKFHILYRARLQEGSITLEKDKMGRPPKEITSSGRANPVGIPYLYLASDIKTAITEIRPHPGENVSVASFKITSDLKLADLRWPKQTISPFEIGIESEIVLLRRDIDFLCHLGTELTKTVIPRVAHLEYLPSQYICEFIKHCGFDGVLYRSSLNDSGMNISLFNDDNVTVKDVEAYNIENINVDFKLIK